MLGIVPAAGAATRLQPLGGSKELLPVGVWRDADGVDRPRAVAEYLLARMARAGADRVLMVVAPGKTDLIRYFGAGYAGMAIAYAIQPAPLGLCDALFRALPFLQAEEPVLIGLPDTIWFPEDALAAAPRDRVHLVTFPVAAPEHFDAVAWQGPEIVERVEVKSPGPSDRRVWGAVAMPAAGLLALHRLWQQPGRRDQFLGHLLNAWIAAGGRVTADRAGTEYWDVGTIAGYRAAMARLGAGEAVQRAA